MSSPSLPSAEDFMELDDQLAADGIPIFSRPFAAAKHWADKTGNILFALENERWFQNAYKSLHPSVDFSADSFLTLAASAQGISYAVKPPIAYGRVAIQPLKHVKISEDEVGRLYRRHPKSFWELQWQACDGVDLFTALVNFHPSEERAKNMMTTAVNQLTASSRQLIASELDASLPQGMAMSVELAGKAILLSMGVTEKELRELGHDLPALAASIAAKVSSPCDATVADVVSELPKYVEVRYDAPILTIVEAHRIFAHSMFVVADFIRRTNHDQLYWKCMTDSKVPVRTFDQVG
jgi:hypothetical protein